MMQFITYNIKAAAIIGIFYLLYILFLKKEVYFQANRMYLLLGVLVAYLTPLIQFNAAISHQISVVQLKPLVVNALAGRNTEVITSSFDFVMLIFLSVAAFFFLRFVFMLIQIGKIIVTNPKQKNKGYVLVFIPDNHAPFSFFHYVFISKEAIHANGSTELLAHEIAHIRHFHSIDKLVVETLSFIQWFNPFYWLLKNELTAIHEFQADAAAVKTSKQSNLYKKILIENKLGIIPTEIANYFNQSLIKKRILMISKNKSSKWTRLKYACILPACMLSVLLFSNFQQRLMAQNNTEKEIYTVVETIPEYPGGQEAMIQFLSENISYPKNARQNGVSGTVYLSFVVTAEGNITKVEVLKNTYNYDGINKNTSLSEDEKASLKTDCERALNNEAIKVVASMPKWSPGEQKGKTVNVQFNLPIKFALN
jgi:hypothetical protein